jgi:hypothetical protein
VHPANLLLEQLLARVLRESALPGKIIMVAGNAAPKHLQLAVPASWRRLLQAHAVQALLRILRVEAREGEGRGANGWLLEGS